MAPYSCTRLGNILEIRIELLNLVLHYYLSVVPVTGHLLLNLIISYCYGLLVPVGADSFSCSSTAVYVSHRFSCPPSERSETSYLVLRKYVNIPNIPINVPVH